MADSPTLAQLTQENEDLDKYIEVLKKMEKTKITRKLKEEFRNLYKLQTKKDAKKDAPAQDKTTRMRADIDRLNDTVKRLKDTANRDQAAYHRKVQELTTERNKSAESEARLSRQAAQISAQARPPTQQVRAAVAEAVASHKNDNEALEITNTALLKLIAKMKEEKEERLAATKQQQEKKN